MEAQLLTRKQPTIGETMPAELDSSTSKLLYLYLTTVSESTVDEIHHDLGIQKLTLFPVLKTLADANLIVRDGDTVTCKTVHPPR